MVTHDRYFLDRVVDRIVELDRGKLISYDGQLHRLPRRARGARSSVERHADQVRREPRCGARPRGSGAGRPRAAHEVEGAALAVRELVDSKPDGADRTSSSSRSRPGRVSARASSGSTARGKSFGGRVIVPPLDLEIGPRRARRRRRARTARARRTFLALCTGDARARPRRGPGRRDREDRVDRPEARASSTARRRCSRRSRARARTIRLGERDDARRVLPRAVPVPAATGSTRRSPSSRAASGTASCLAKLLRKGGNVLVLDEPTNDLDVATLRALEEALAEFDGTRPRRQPRPLVPRPGRDAHARVRGGLADDLVRGVVPGVLRLGARDPRPGGARAPIASPTSDWFIQVDRG